MPAIGSGKRTAVAALRIAVEMAGEGLISRDEAVTRIDPSQLDQLLHPMIDPAAKVEVAARGLNASPGAASGEIVLDADTAAARGKAGDDVILVRWETTPDDIHGLIEARGVLTASRLADLACRGRRPRDGSARALQGVRAQRSTSRPAPSRIGTHELRVGDVITIGRRQRPG